MKRVLFVDDEPNVLSGLRRMLRPMSNEWDMRFAGNGLEALDMMMQEPADILISDMRMPLMDGFQLLRTVQNEFPDTVRIILSGYSDQEAAMQTVGVTHQFLSKPCEPEKLKATITRAFITRDMLKNEHLARLLASVKSLPSLPSLYTELLTELSSEDSSIKGVAEIVSRDVAMTSKLLQLVNSAFFGLTRHVSNPANAVSLLGFDMIKTLVLSVKVFSQFEGCIHPENFSFSKLRQHSLLTGALARQIARIENADQFTQDNALAAGLLHDQGKLILATNLAEDYSRVLFEMEKNELTIEAAEQMVLGADHAQVGAYLLGIWGLPDTLVEAARFHHDPSVSPPTGFSVLAAVHVANALAHGSWNEEPEDEVATGRFRLPPNVRIDYMYLEKEGLIDRLPLWYKAFKKLNHPGTPA